VKDWSVQRDRQSLPPDSSGVFLDNRDVSLTFDMKSQLYLPLICEEYASPKGTTLSES
jgi:hypothetical protein